MTASAIHLLPALKALTQNDRAELAHVLINSLADDGEDELSAEWDAELSRRKEGILSGKAEGIAASEVFAALSAKYS